MSSSSSRSLQHSYARYPKIRSAFVLPLQCHEPWTSSGQNLPRFFHPYRLLVITRDKVDRTGVTEQSSTVLSLHNDRLLVSAPRVHNLKDASTTELKEKTTNRTENRYRKSNKDFHDSKPSGKGKAKGSKKGRRVCVCKAASEAGISGEIEFPFLSHPMSSVRFRQDAGQGQPSQSLLDRWESWQGCASPLRRENCLRSCRVQLQLPLPSPPHVSVTAEAAVAARERKKERVAWAPHNPTVFWDFSTPLARGR